MKCLAEPRQGAALDRRLIAFAPALECFGIIEPEAVALVDAADKQAILEKLSDVFAASYGLDAGEVLEHLEERERLGSTGFGRGVAIPHARMARVAGRPVAALLKLRHPADFAAADGLAVDLVFGLLVPQNCNEEHLKILAQLAEMFLDEAFCAKARATSDPLLLHDLLVNYAPAAAA